MTPPSEPDEPVVIAVGSINADHQVRLPRPVSTGTTLASAAERAPGGKAANVAVGARRLGIRAALVGCVGGDDLAPLALSGPTAAGVDLRGVRTVDVGTGLSVVLVQEDGSKAIVLALAANAEPHPDLELVRGIVSSASAGSVLVASAEAHPELVAAAVEAAGSDVAVIIDPAPPELVPAALLDRADHLVPDHHEASVLSGVEVGDVATAVTAAERLHERGPTWVHVKLPEGGAVSVSDSGRWMARSPDDLHVVDTNGAGDAFAIGLVTALVRGLPADAVLRAATAASAVAVEGWGAQASFPDREQLDQMAARVEVRALD